MYLKKIEAIGFKSFAHRVAIEFDLGLHAIVGPNGSGKSNVVDAVRWVLGEQSAKTLRGGNMQDIIFKGSESKKQLGFAEVTLTLDNEDHQLPLAYDEVTITRRLYRNGESLYLINKQKVRLQDITNLFMDSGIGRESFSIIGQGRIDEILNSKPTERRAIFEEAAGVLKYKSRKEKTLRRLERTHQNLQRVQDILSELEQQVQPLEKQAQTAKQFIEYRDKLQDLEISVLSYDIKIYRQKLEHLEVKQAGIDQELIDNTISWEQLQQTVEKQNAAIFHIEQQIEAKQNQLLELAKSIEQEKAKINMDEQKKNYLITTLKQIDIDIAKIEQQSFLFDEEHTQKDEATFLSQQEKLKQERTEIDMRKQKAQLHLQKVQQQKIDQLQQVQSVKTRLQTLQEMQDSYGQLFSGVRSVLLAAKEGKLCGIAGTLLDLITVDQKYVKAIETSLANSLQYIVTTDQKTATQAINYLKSVKQGKATFLPLDVIKGVKISEQELEKIKQATGFIGIATDLASYDEKYSAIFAQQLGTTLVVDTLNNANILAKKLQFRYRLITLEGDVVHRGGSMSGGALRHEKTGLLMQKETLKKLAMEQKKLEKALQGIEENIAIAVNEVAQLNRLSEQKHHEYMMVEQQKKIYAHQKEQNQLQMENYADQLAEYRLRKQNAQEEIEQLQEEKEHLGEQLKKLEQKETLLQQELNNLQTQKYQQQKLGEDSAKQLKVFEQTERALEKDKQAISLEMNTLEVQIVNKLQQLQDNYELYLSLDTLENYDLPNYTEAENEMKDLKKKIQKMGVVNLGAIDEYQRVYERFHDLNNQKIDLNQAEDNLLKIIHDMDHEMKQRFEDTFTLIQKNFTDIFAQLFGGGKANLQLETEGDYLTRGIEIFVQPPGKKIQNLSLLSGGERALTAIALLFAILKTKHVPFCILDEVEAALDDANVDRFASYLKIFSQGTQFIVVTHRKGTMEEADSLYGVTMEEAGISKILSVRLQEANKIVDQ